MSESAASLVFQLITAPDEDMLEDVMPEIVGGVVSEAMPVAARVTG
jgi:hypothetical protein